MNTEINILDRMTPRSSLAIDLKGWECITNPNRGAQLPWSTSNNHRRTYQQINRWFRKMGRSIRLPVPSNDRLSHLQQQARVRKAINKAQFYCDLETGRAMMAVEVAGMDCDCSQFSYLTYIPATRAEYEREAQSLYDWADGPLSVSPVPAGEVDNFKAYSRDLALEAFEDGHPHVVYTA